MEIPSEAYQAIGGTAGIAAIIYAVIEFMKSRSRTKRMDESTARNLLHEDYLRKEREAAKGWRLKRWYQHEHSRVREELLFRCGEPEDRERFPSAPPHDWEDL